MTKLCSVMPAYRAPTGSLIGGGSAGCVLVIHLVSHTQSALAARIPPAPYLWPPSQETLPLWGPKFIKCKQKLFSGKLKLSIAVESLNSSKAPAPSIHSQEAVRAGRNLEISWCQPLLLQRGDGSYIARG